MNDTPASHRIAALQASRDRLVHSFAAFAALWVFRIILALFVWAVIPAHERRSHTLILAVDGLSFLALLAAYVLFSLAVLAALKQLAEEASGYLAVLVAAPVLFALLTVVPSLPGGFFVANLILGTPVAIHIKVLGSIDEALREFTSLS